jgi:site-specific recombinase XerD
MKTFETYLQKKGYRPRTIYGYQNKLNQFFNWCNLNEINSDTASLEQLYQYKNDLTEQGLSTHTIRQLFSVVKLYYNSIQRIDNPALLIKHKKRQETLPSNLLSENELKELYVNISVNTFIQRRDKALFGFIIFQGLKQEELEKLEIHYLDFNETTVYVPASARTNARTLELHPMQIKHLMDYFYEYRALLLREANKETNKLFFSMGSGTTLNNALQRKLNELKRSYRFFKSITQIKESRMSIWVKQHGVRKAQYFSGIRYASSMLRYKTTDMEKLKMKLAVVHPLEQA